MAQTSDRVVEAPSGDADQFHVRAMGLRVTANDLHLRFNEMMSGVSGLDAYRPAGYMVAVVTLRAFATECALKALAIRTQRSYLVTHDLLDLFDFLKEPVRLFLERAYGSGPMTMRATMQSHRRDFVEWRYPTKQVSSVNSEDLEPALSVCLDVYGDADMGACVAD